MFERVKNWHRKADTMYKAVFYAMALHVLAFIILLLLARADHRPEELISIRISNNNRIPESERKQIEKAVKKVEEQKKNNNKKSVYAKRLGKSSSQTKQHTLKQEDQDYYRHFNDKTRTSDSTSPSSKSNRNKDSSWHEDLASTGKANKGITHENVKIPGGRVGIGGNTWTKGGARKLLHISKPRYPEYYRKKALQFRVKAIIEVDKQGHVIRVTLTKGSGYGDIDIAVKRAFLNARFSSGDRKSIGVQTMNFNLNR